MGVCLDVLLKLFQLLRADTLETPWYVTGVTCKAFAAPAEGTLVPEVIVIPFALGSWLDVVVVMGWVVAAVLLSCREKACISASTVELARIVLSDASEVISALKVIPGGLLMTAVRVIDMRVLMSLVIDFSSTEGSKYEEMAEL